jgi:ketosteroid isomerase-like protein
LRFEPAEFIDAGGDRVVLVKHGVGRGGGSGANVELDFSTVSTLRDGRLARHITFIDHAEAREAAGLAGVGECVQLPRPQSDSSGQKR